LITDLICLVIGSVLGGIARYVVSAIVARRFGEAFPWGTLLINVTGAFLIGIFGARATHDVSLLAQPAPWLFAVTGFLGCYTTVSSFSLQTLILAHDGKLRGALGNVVFSVGICLAAVTAGFALSEWLGA
jgi:fluoride exporter